MVINLKTIAIFSAYYYPHLGGIERYIDNLMKKFVEKNINVILITSNYNNQKDYDIINNIKIYRLPVYNAFKNRYPIIKKNKKYREIMNEIEKISIDRIIVNTRFHLTSHIGAKLGKKNSIPVYLIEHGSNYVTLDNKFIDFFANRYEDFLTCKIKNKITGFYGVSEAAASWIKKFKIKAQGVWYNSIDAEQKLPKRVQHKGISFLYAGRLIKQKGVENILMAFTELEKKYKDITLYIAGDGPEFEYYKENYKRKNINFLGKLTYEELVKYYAKTDVFLYPPLWPEGLPTSILEAGLMRCSIIGTNQGGIKEIIKNNENGLIVTEDVKGVHDGMEKLIKEETLRKKLADQIYKDVCEKFSWEHTSNKIISDIGLR